MASNPTPGVQYPNLDTKVHKSVHDGMKLAFDNIFYLRNQVDLINRNVNASAAVKSQQQSGGSSSSGGTLQLVVGIGGPINYQFQGVPILVFVNGVVNILGTHYAQKPGSNVVAFNTALTPVTDFTVTALVMA